MKISYLSQGGLVEFELDQETETKLIALSMTRGKSLKDTLESVIDTGIVQQTRYVVDDKA